MYLPATFQLRAGLKGRDIILIFLFVDCIWKGQIPFVKVRRRNKFLRCSGRPWSGSKFLFYTITLNLWPVFGILMDRFISWFLSLKRKKNYWEKYFGEVKRAWTYPPFFFLDCHFEKYLNYNSSFNLAIRNRISSFFQTKKYYVIFGFVSN